MASKRAGCSCMSQYTETKVSKVFMGKMTVCQKHVFGGKRYRTMKSWGGKPVRSLGDLPV